jgi:hypothetical protein
VQPVGAHLGVCTSTQLSDYFTACQAAAATTQSCDAWKQVPGNMACSGCVETPSNAGAYGAIISYANVNLDQINLAGCIALVEPCNQPCSAAILAQLQCENAACTSPFCADFASYQTCAGQADTCADCSGFVSAADCQAQLAASASQHPAVSACNLGAASFQDFFTTIATLMCGS